MKFQLFYVTPLNLPQGHRIRAKRNKIVAVTFWATWCKVCQEHIPELNTIHEKYKEKGVEIIGVSLDNKLKEVKDFVESKGIAYPIFRAKDKEEMSYIYNVRKIPIVYYYKNGELEHIEEGYTDPKHIEEDLRSCLEGSKPPSKDANSKSKYGLSIPASGRGIINMW